MCVFVETLKHNTRSTTINNKYKCKIIGVDFSQLKTIIPFKIMTDQWNFNVSTKKKITKQFHSDIF